MTIISDKPVWAIFLDIDGVLNEGIPSLDKFLAKKKELYPGVSDITPMQMKRVEAQFLNKQAVEHLHALIERVSEVAKVVIVLSSIWRFHGEIEAIKDTMFVDWKFAEYLIDKTPTYMNNAMEKIVLSEWRWKEIRLWLNECSKKHNIQSYVILDDDHEFPEERFVRINCYKLLSEQDVEEALKKISKPLSVESPEKKISTE